MADMGRDGRTVTGISRRTALKGLGVGAAALWATPTIVSMATPAFAGSNFNNCPTPSCETESEGNCRGSFQCGTGCSGGPGCFGVTDTEGNCFCAQGSTCGALVECTSSK